MRRSRPSPTRKGEGLDTRRRAGYGRVGICGGCRAAGFRRLPEQTFGEAPLPAQGNERPRRNGDAGLRKEDLPRPFGEVDASVACECAKGLLLLPAHGYRDRTISRLLGGNPGLGIVALRPPLAGGLGVLLLCLGRPLPLSCLQSVRSRGRFLLGGRRHDRRGGALVELTQRRRGYFLRLNLRFPETYALCHEHNTNAFLPHARG